MSAVNGITNQKINLQFLEDFAVAQLSDNDLQNRIWEVLAKSFGLPVYDEQDHDYREDVKANLSANDCSHEAALLSKIKFNGKTDTSIIKVVQAAKDALEKLAKEDENHTIVSNSYEISPQQRERSASIGRACVSVERKLRHSEMVNLKNEWLLTRTHYRLSQADALRLREFQYSVLASISSLMIAIKAIDSGKVAKKANTFSSFADAAIASAISFIPVCGPFLAKAVEFACPAEKISGNSQIKSYKKLSQYLVLFKQMDSICEEFASLLTAYYQAEILKPSENFTVMQKWTQPVKEFVNNIVEWVTSSNFQEQYIFGTDCKKIEPDISYKKHWKQLLSNIVGGFLTNVDDLSFERVLDHQTAALLSSSLTPVSSAPLMIDPSSDPRVLAHSLCRIAQLAYETERKIDELAQLWGYAKGDTYEFSFKDDIQGFLFINSERAIVGFRGTDTAANCMTDARCGTIKPWSSLEANTLEVHEGFWNGLQKVWPSIKDKIKASNCREIWFSGHSLGGALALLAATDLSLDKNDPGQSIHLYTYGQPKCGSKLFASKVNELIPSYYRFINYLDSVPEIPTEFLLGYAHAGKLRWLDFKGDHCVDEEGFIAAKSEKDEYGKSKIRDASRIICISDHSIAHYEKKLRGQVPSEHNALSFSDYIQHEFGQLNYSWDFQNEVPRINGALPPLALPAASSSLSAVQSQQIQASATLPGMNEDPSALTPKQERALPLVDHSMLAASTRWRENQALQFQTSKVILDKITEKLTILTPQQESLLHSETQDLLELKANPKLRMVKLSTNHNQLSTIKNILERNKEILQNVLAEKAEEVVRLERSMPVLQSKIVHLKLQREFFSKGWLPFYGSYVWLRYAFDNKYYPELHGEVGRSKFGAAILGIPGLNTVMLTLVPFPLLVHSEKEKTKEKVRLNSNEISILKEKTIPTLRNQVRDLEARIQSVIEKIEILENELDDPTFS